MIRVLGAKIKELQDRFPVPNKYRIVDKFDKVVWVGSAFSEPEAWNLFKTEKKYPPSFPVESLMQGCRKLKMECI